MTSFYHELSLVSGRLHRCRQPDDADPVFDVDDLESDKEIPDVFEDAGTAGDYVFKSGDDVSFADMDSLVGSDPKVTAAFLCGWSSSDEMTYNTVVKYPRASTFQSCCVRQHVIATLLGGVKKVEGRSTVSGDIPYKFGHAIHSYVQETGEVFGERRRGWWRCMACERFRYFGPPPSPAVSCPFCRVGHKVFKFEEATVVATAGDVFPDKYKETRYAKLPLVTGHPDLYLASSPTSRHFRVTELKSMKGTDFDKLAAPVIAHLWQVMIYARFSQELPHCRMDRDTSYVCYLSKEGKRDSFPMKVFSADTSQKSRAWLQITDKLWQFAESVVAIAEAGGIKKVMRREEDYLLPPAAINCKAKFKSGREVRGCPCSVYCKLMLEKGEI